MTGENALFVSSSPHIHSKETTPRLMLWVCISLLPACAWGVYSFGFRALLVLAVSVVSSAVFEHIFSIILFKKSTLKDCSALVTGMLIGMNLSAAVPLYVPVVASLFAIAVAKMTFGGLGQNFINPALAGRVFVFFSFTAAMSFFPQHRVFSDYRSLEYPAAPLYSASVSSASVSSASLSSASTAHESQRNDSPALTQRKVDSLTSASPLASYKSNPMSKKMNNLQYMESVGYPFTRFSKGLSESIGINPYIIDAFFGFKNGCIGEISAFLLLVGVVVLIFKRLISYVIPVFYIGIYMVLEWVFGGLAFGQGLFCGEVAYSVFTGGIFLCAFFMATDMVTSPVTAQGHAIYAALLAVMTFLIRRFSALPEGVSIALMLANIAVPTINRHCRRRVFGVKR